MSTLKVSNITDTSGGATTLVSAQNTAKAWINMNGTGTIAINDSLNVSSIADRGTGQFTVYFDTDFTTDSYVLSMIAQYLDYTASQGQGQYSARIDHKYTDRHQFTIANTNQTEYADPGRLDIIYFGD